MIQSWPITRAQYPRYKKVEEYEYDEYLDSGIEFFDITSLYRFERRSDDYDRDNSMHSEESEFDT